VKIAAYIRVSSKNKSDHEPSAAEQERKLRAWAKAHGHVIAAIYRDEGLSGANGLASRTGLPEALRALKSGKAHGLAVSRLDRLSRDMILQEQLLAEVRRLGGQPFSASPAEDEFLADDPDDPSRALIRRILGAVNQYERDMIALRLRGGKTAKRARGGYTGGVVPIGYRREGRELVPDSNGEHEAVARIAALRAEGQSYRQIIATLEAEGIAPRTAQRWSPSTVRRAALRAGVS
jgi:DNA invertase Pin-like site-specific DNA recombinase